MIFCSAIQYICLKSVTPFSLQFKLSILLGEEKNLVVLMESGHTRALTYQGEPDELGCRTVESLRNQRYADKTVLTVKARSKVKKMLRPVRILSIIESNAKSCVLNKDETKLTGKYTTAIMLATFITLASFR